jgi:hypothetical protein
MTMQIVKAYLSREARMWGYVLILIAAWIGMAAVPGTWWLDVRSVTVTSAPSPAAVILQVDQTIERPFFGIRSVALRQSPGGVLVCTNTRRMIPYHPEISLPDPVSLQWWLGSASDLQDCVDNGFGPRTYTLETCWTIVAPFMGFWPDKRFCVNSTLFRIGAPT